MRWWCCRCLWWLSPCVPSLDSPLQQSLVVLSSPEVAVLVGADDGAEGVAAAGCVESEGRALMMAWSCPSISVAHSCSEKTPSPFSFHAKSMASQSPFARQLPPLTCFLITSKCCSRITPRFLKSESLPSSLNVSRGNDIPFRENAACASSVQCTYVCNVVYCCTACCTSTAVLLYGAPPPQCSYCSRHRLSGRRSYLHPQFTAQLVGACSYWHLGTEHVFLWPCAYYYYFFRLKFLTTKFLTGDAVCIRETNK